MKEPRVYEIGYLLVPQIREEEIDVRVDALRKMITDKSGLPISEGRPELITLAYPMSKDIENKRQEYTKGYFGWIKFDISPESVVTLKKELDATLDVVRYLILSTVREDTRIQTSILSTVKSLSKKEDGIEEVPLIMKHEETPVEEINEVELDKKIDELTG